MKRLKGIDPSHDNWLAHLWKKMMLLIDVKFESFDAQG